MNTSERTVFTQATFANGRISMSDGTDIGFAPIILTGAMTPLGFEGSDGLQNLTESLFAARLLQPGVFVVMHNQAFPVRSTEKDYRLSRFVWKNTETT